jgi:hypothetical protein
VRPHAPIPSCEVHSKRTRDEIRPVSGLQRLVVPIFGYGIGIPGGPAGGLGTEVALFRLFLFTPARLLVAAFPNCDRASIAEGLEVELVGALKSFPPFLSRPSNGEETARDAPTVTIRNGELNILSSLGSGQRSFTAAYTTIASRIEYDSTAPAAVVALRYCGTAPVPVTTSGMLKLVWLASRIGATHRCVSQYQGSRCRPAPSWKRSQRVRRARRPAVSRCRGRCPPD